MIWVVTVFLTLVALLWVLLVLAVVAGSRDRRFVLGRAAPTRKNSPRVSLIIPARNEEAVIARAVRSALDQDYKNLEVMVVDDASEDRTREEALQAGAGDDRLRVIAGRALPEGWLGKPSACWRGQEEASGEILLFVDADVMLDSQAVRRSVETLLEKDLGLLSLWGTWVMDSFWMKVAQPVVGGFVRGAHPLDQCNDPGKEVAFANGQFIMVRREAYDRFGGHEAVKNEVLEDVRFAQRAQESGVKIGMFLAPDLFRVRLYTTLPELWSGMVKNFYHGMGRKPALALVAALFVTSTTLFPLAILPLLWAMQWWIALIPGGLIVLLMLIYRFIQDPGVGVSRWYGVTHPLGSVILVGIIVTSMWRGLRRKPTLWKGRPVQG